MNTATERHFPKPKVILATSNNKDKLYNSILAQLQQIGAQGFAPSLQSSARSLIVDLTSVLWDLSAHHAGSLTFYFSILLHLSCRAPRAILFRLIQRC